MSRQEGLQERTRVRDGRLGHGWSTRRNFFPKTAFFKTVPVLTVLEFLRGWCWSTA